MVFWSLHLSLRSTVPPSNWILTHTLQTTTSSWRYSCVSICCDSHCRRDVSPVIDNTLTTLKFFKLNSLIIQHFISMLRFVLSNLLIYKV